MTVEQGTSDEIRSGFLLAYTDAPQDGSTKIGGKWTIMYEAPNDELADHFMASGIATFYERVTHGTLRMFVIIARAMLNLGENEPRA